MLLYNQSLLNDGVLTFESSPMGSQMVAIYLLGVVPPPGPLLTSLYLGFYPFSVHPSKADAQPMFSCFPELRSIWYCFVVMFDMVWSI